MGPIQSCEYVSSGDGDGCLLPKIGVGAFLLFFVFVFLGCEIRNYRG